MIYTNNAINIVTTKSYKGIGRAWIIKNLRGNESEGQIVSLLKNKSKHHTDVTIDDFKLKKQNILKQINALGNNCDGLVAIGDSNFPEVRGEVKESERPIFLFYKGDINLLNIKNNNVAVIGLLNPDQTIETREIKIVSELVKKDMTIVSGLAFGCDSIAHKQAIECGKTIAILPSTLCNILPSKNKVLGDAILKKGGLLITEYYNEFTSKMELSSRYKERDRLQALFSDTVILIASYAQDSAKRWNVFDKKLDSGARLAMEYAKNYNIPRAVMYDKEFDKENPMFDLNRKIISESINTTILTAKNLENITNEIKAKINKPIQQKLFN